MLQRTKRRTPRYNEVPAPEIGAARSQMRKQATPLRRVRSVQSCDIVAVRERAFDEVGADETARAGDEELHAPDSMSPIRDVTLLAVELMQTLHIFPTADFLDERCTN